ncbi:MAG: molecular chaperone DnaJ [bacterium]|nr:molecular chaperone DnaJ [bacterium]
MEAKRDLYEVLGLSRSAEEREIKASYRILAHKYHPDKNPGDKSAEEKFKEASVAYSILTDVEKRARYDQFGHAGLGNSGAEDFSVNIQDIFGSIFGDFFGSGSNKRSQGERGADLKYDLTITFEQAAFGVEKEIEIKRHDACGTCSGSGAKPGTNPIPCRDCQGLGEVRVSQGFFAIAQTCPSCQGSGQRISEVCLDCKGRKRQKVAHTIKVTVPPGIDNGMQLRYISEGDGGIKGGARGNLYVAINVKNHSLFVRQDNDVTLDVPITFVQAALGTAIEVPTLDGKFTLQIPAGTQPETVFCIPKKGIPSLQRNGNGKRGDQLVKVCLEVPTNLSKQQKDLLIEFANLSGEDTLPARQGFFDKVKEIFG